MRVTWPKITALLIACGYVAVCAVGVVRSGAPRHELAYLVVLLFPLALIWFPEPIGGAVGYIGHGLVDRETPAWLVSAAGWFFLVGFPILLWLIG